MKTSEYPEKEEKEEKKEEEEGDGSWDRSFLAVNVKLDLEW